MTDGPAVVTKALERAIVGQAGVIEGLLLGLICGGHVLLEGPPGLAKTLACRSLADALHGEFKRIQFTPDLLPSDIVGTRIFDQRESAFTTVRGPIFANVVLADEINRAPAKVQSALLEAMQERQVTIGPQTHPLPDPFIVMATMNPLDSEGTYALPVAQMDRFLIKIDVGYPSRAEELAIMDRFAIAQAPVVTPVATLEACAYLARSGACGAYRRGAQALYRRARRDHTRGATSRDRPWRFTARDARDRQSCASQSVARCSATTRFPTTYGRSRRLRYAIGSVSIFGFRATAARRACSATDRARSGTLRVT